VEFSLSKMVCEVLSAALPSGRSKLDIEKAVQYLDDNAEEGSTSHCAKYVRLALKAGGVTLDPAPGLAKDYGPALLHEGFISVPWQDCTPVKGDVCVIQPYPRGNPAGHVQMFNGEIWVSDFANRNGFWPGSAYKEHKPPYAIYRP